MRYSQLIGGIFLFCCFFSILLADNDFNSFEEDVLLNPAAIGQAADDVIIYSASSSKTSRKALASHLNDIQLMQSVAMAVGANSGEFSHYLKLNSDGIKVYLFSHKQSKFGTFKAITHIKASMDSILAVMFDNTICAEWVHSCGQSFILDDVSFTERYHYQTFYIPFPFSDRDFIFHSIMVQNPRSRTVDITMFGVPDYCNDKQSIQCDKVNQSELVRVRKSIGTYKLEPDSMGTKITWIQHTDPGGNIPAWLVNQFAASTPYWTFKNLAEMVKQEKYKYAKLIYNKEGVATALEVPILSSRVKKLTMTSGDKKLSNID